MQGFIVSNSIDNQFSGKIFVAVAGDAWNLDATIVNSC